ncbi:MAG: nitrogen fixation protein NifZ [Rhodospirillaceae bacterium]
MPTTVPLAQALDEIEIYRPPALSQGTRVRVLRQVRNDGTFPGRARGEILIEPGEEGYVASIGTFLQRYYIFGVDFFRLGIVVGMRAHELEVVAGSPPGERNRQ